MMKANMEWVSEMHFRCDNHGIITNIDAVKDHGGNDSGPTPKELVLNGMMGCTAMDVVSILKKMRQEIASFSMEVEAEKTTDYPTHFKTAVLIYKLKGKIDPDKAIKAVESSMTKYCGVNYMISKTCDITYKVILNDIEINQGGANFEDPAKG